MFAADRFVPLRLNALWWPRLLAAAAAVLCVWLGVRIAWLLLAGPTVVAPLPTTADLPAVASAQAPALPLSSWHLFGDGGATLDIAQRVQVAPETPLQLILRGTLNLDSSDGGIAIIADERGADEAYRVGDTLPGEAQLVAIYAGRVLLRRNGVDEGLSLLPGNTGSAAPLRPTAGPRPASQLPPGLSTPGLPGSPGAPFVNPSISTGAPSLDSLRAATNTDIAELARQVNVQPVLENGRFAGVRLTVGRDSDLLARTGLRATDLITAVNGIPLDGPQRSTQLLEMLQTARQLNLTIRRDGATQTLTVGL
jgi:general secretion pathway protein C